VVNHHIHILMLEYADSYLNRYEWTEMVLLHKSLFASKWMQAMRTALGGTFTGDNVFALLYVMYNPVCRRDIHQKKRMANQMLAEALLPVELEYSRRQKNFLFYIKSSWEVFKFAIKSRALADCNPTLVLSASKHAHAAIFKDLNRILLLVENCERNAQTNWNIARNSILASARVVQALKKIPVNSQDSQTPFDHDENHHARHPSQTLYSSVTWLQQIKNCWKRTNRVVPIQIDNQQRHDDVPKLFVDQFNLKRAFLEENIDEEARLSLLTLMIFPDAEDFGSSRDCKVYKKQFDENLESFRNSFRALFRLSQDLKSIDSSETLTRKKSIFQRISDMIFGEEMKLLRNFHSLADEEAVNLFHRHHFPELETEFERIPSVEEVLKQLAAKEMNTSIEDPTVSSQSQAPQGTHQNMFPSMLLEFAPATHEPPERHVAKTGGAALAAAKGPGPHAVRSRPVMYSSQRILAAARESAGIGHSNFAGLLQQDMTSEDAVTCAELSRAHAAIASLAEQVKGLKANLQIETANARNFVAKEAIAQEESLRMAERVKSLEAKEAELLRRAAAAESNVLALSAQLTDLQAVSSDKSESSDTAATSAEFPRACAAIVGLTEQVKSLKANLQIETANAHNVLAKESELKENLLHMTERAKNLEAKEAESLRWHASAMRKEPEKELLQLRAEAKETAAVAVTSTAPATDLQGAQQSIKSLEIHARAADDQSPSVDAESEQVALVQRNTLHKAKVEADAATSAAEFDGVNAESVGWNASEGCTVAAAGESPNPNLSHLQTRQLTLPFLQAPPWYEHWKQKVIKAGKAPSAFKEVSQLPLIFCGNCMYIICPCMITASCVSILFDTNHCLTIVPQFLVLSIMQKGLHQTGALASFLQSSKQAFVERNPAASLDDAEADQIIQELRAELRL
jgi:hypothetical protein